MTETPYLASSMQTEHHHTQIAIHKEEAKKLNRKALFLASFRFSLFIAALAAFVYFANAAMFSSMLLSALLFVLSFMFLVKQHNIVEDKLQMANNKVLFHEKELSRMALSITHFDGAQELLDAAHAYAKDLDILGDYSLFQLLDCSATQPGRSTLANWLLNPAGKEEILARQQASQELAENESWRKDFFSKVNMLNRKLKQKPKSDFVSFDSNNLHFSIALKWLGILIFPFALFLWQLHIVTYHVPFYVVPAFNFLYLVPFRKKTNSFQDTLLGFYPELKSLLNASHLLTKEQWKSAKMDTISTYFKGNKQIPLKKLAKILEYQESRNTLVYSILSAFFLFECLMVLAAVRWHKKYAAELPRLIQAMADTEALISFAAWQKRNPTVYPVISKENHLQAEGMLHPLIGQQAVANPVTIRNKGGMMLITGSNMSGKSTYMRTLGINLVLAMAGAPVMAKSMQLPMMRIYTSMRKYDDLQSQSSTFYSELKRLQAILNLATQQGHVVFFMLDEILNGTNSHDRLRGTESYLSKLLLTNAMGMITTHDLELTALADKWQGVENYSFNSSLKEGKIVFDYTLTQGPCRSFNAFDLMKSMDLA